MMKCKYCENEAAKRIVWLHDRAKKPDRISLPWCGCDLMVALKRYWPNPYEVYEGIHYEVEPLVDPIYKALERIMPPEDVTLWVNTPNKAYLDKTPKSLIGTILEKLIWRTIYEVESGTPT